MMISLFGGLALFLFGMNRMGEALKAVAGGRLKQILARLTSNRFAGALSGATVTAVIQSSSVTTVLVVGFVSAGLMTLSQAIGVIMGANIGTTITAQIIAFKVTKLALLFIAVGFAIDFISRNENFKQYGRVIFGLGLIFLGMNVMGEAMLPLHNFSSFNDLMQGIERPGVGILYGAVFTALIQSSSATTGIVVVMASQGFITLQAGIALALGANIGTCLKAILAAVGKTRPAQRSAAIHVLFDPLGVLLWLGFIDELAQLAQMVSPSYEKLTGLARLAAETPRQIANANTIFNLFNTLLFIGFTGPMAWIV
ncbi:MAG: Na/Pi cotransporter family protein, partial [Deltaproteobacteria bacterium]|nr:Na/Pi cotransporter family protein [Deltaproteobacteria bacterium]